MFRWEEAYKAAKLLGIEDGTTLDEKAARRAYSKYARTWHPDVASNRGVSEEEANAKMAEGNKAFATLKQAIADNGGTYDVVKPASSSYTPPRSSSSSSNTSTSSSSSSSSSGSSAGRPTGRSTGSSTSSTWSDSARYDSDPDYVGEWTYDQDNGWHYEVHRRDGKDSGSTRSSTTNSSASRSSSSDTTPTYTSGGDTGGVLFALVMIGLFIWFIWYVGLSGDANGEHLVNVLAFMLNPIKPILLGGALWLLWASGK